MYDTFNRILPFRDLRSKPWPHIGKRAGFKALQVGIGLLLLLSPCFPLVYLSELARQYRMRNPPVYRIRR